MLGKKIELLAPAGSLESALAAVRSGADAIYIGGKDYSARASASNFTNNEIEEVVRYCHSRNVDVHVAVNTLIKNSEFSKVLEFIEFLAGIPVDALIIQDIGLACVIKKAAPNIPIHASTQMSVHTSAGARYLSDAGFSRVVLSRELSKKEISEISKNTSAELEIFAHGAQCMSVSGQCYFSAFLGSRSANRGACAGPCRLPFSHNRENRYDLSLKDMCIINHVNELSEIGVSSIKIEGRMKRPEYVSATVAMFRKALDGGEVTEDDINMLKSVFSRSGFTDGYYMGNLGQRMFGIRSKDDVSLADSKFLGNIRNLYKREMKRICVDFEITIKRDLPVSLKARCLGEKEVLALGEVPKKALTSPINRETCIKQLSKTGDTQFFCRDVTCNIDEGLCVPASCINKLRRDSLSLLNERLADRAPTSFSISKPSKVSTLNEHVVENKIQKRACFINSYVPDAFSEFEFVFIPLFSELSDFENLLKRNMNVAAKIPRGMFSLETAIKRRLSQLKALGIHDVLASNIGAIEIARRFDMNIHGGFGLNLTNDYSLRWAENFGIKDIEVSLEIKAKEIAGLSGNIKRGIFAYGRVPLMLTRNCPVAHPGCRKCKQIQYIRDRKNVLFPVVCDSGCSEILNSVPLNVSDRLDDFKNIDFITFNFTTETREFLDSFESEKIACDNFTRGLYYRGII